MDTARVSAFNERYEADPGATGPWLSWARKDTLRLLDFEPVAFTDFMGAAARSSYGQGLFRVLGPQTVPPIGAFNSADGWAGQWPEYAGRLIVFAYDWLGRLYGLDTTRVLQREPLVSRLDPGSAKLQESDTSFAEFVLGDLLRYGDEMLSTALFKDWLAHGGRPLKEGEVAAYKVLPAAGGAEAVTNLQVGRLEAYIALCGRASHKATPEPPKPERKGGLLGRFGRKG